MTPHKNCVSLKNTINAQRIIPIPKANIVINISGYITNRYDVVILVPVIKITKNNGTKEIKRLTPDDSVLDIGYIYFGTYTFVINETLDIIDVNVILTASLKKLNITTPISKYTI